MTRKKLNQLTYIVSDAKRKATYKKRKASLIKKIDQISTLCGIEACAIIYGPISFSHKFGHPIRS
ncbi:putative transcription factor MADS-type1 family [Lupinus albus]|uniref:Putative transcription factor MADS-type1 family n=1 Tax=Lupinus albus TaxID=3870 RepID=A0A6A4P6Z7_LUPAL|nr:putative transcription factor MADS-type1 family [Lupinus albus]